MVLNNHTNSADFSGNLELNDVTSYLFSYFLAGKINDDKKISILNFGDMMFGRAIKEKVLSGINPFEKIRGTEGNFLRGIDFISANLEGPITDSKDCIKKIVSFKFPLKTAEIFFKNKINIVNLANNHIFDCGSDWQEDIFNILKKFGINYFGGNSLENSYIVKEVNGKKIIFLGINALGAKDLNNYYQLMKEIKKDNYLIVNIHWGNESGSSPSFLQKEFAYSLIDNGADVVIGHHPHIIQPVEIYKNKPIFYSLGNFIFDQQTEETIMGFGVGTIFGDTKEEFYIFPYKLVNYQPDPFSFADSKKFCDKLLFDVKTEKDVCYFSL